MRIKPNRNKKGTKGVPAILLIKRINRLHQRIMNQMILFLTVCKN